MKSARASVTYILTDTPKKGEKEISSISMKDMKCKDPRQQANHHTHIAKHSASEIHHRSNEAKEDITKDYEEAQLDQVTCLETPLGHKIASHEKDPNHNEDKYPWGSYHNEG